MSRDHLLDEYLDEWLEDRKEGRTMRVLHEKVTGLDQAFREHALEDTRLFSKLENDAKRNAELRLTAPAPARSAPELDAPLPFYKQSPWKEVIGYGAVVAITIMSTWAAARLGIAAPPVSPITPPDLALPAASAAHKP